MMCHRIGFPPISIMGLGLRWVSSEMRVPRPPAKMTVFIENNPVLQHSHVACNWLTNQKRYSSQAPSGVL